MNARAPGERAAHLGELQAGEGEHVKVMPQPLQASASGRQPASIDEVFERRLLKEAHGHGMFVDLHMGAAATPTTIFVHGLPGAASSLIGVIQKAIDDGGTVKAFAYDNKFRSLEDSSRDLANAIETWMDDNPTRAVRVTAHSMGGRLALGALSILKGDGRLTGDVELNLIASPIADRKSAIFSLLAPGFLPGSVRAAAWRRSPNFRG